jgi:hypothetical protein
MSVEDWSSVPNDPFPHGNFWGSPDFFEPEVFSQNVTVENRWDDVFWAVLFLVDFVASGPEISKGMNISDIILQTNRWSCLMNCAFACAMNWRMISQYSRRIFQGY